MRRFDDLPIRVKLLGSFAIVLVFLVAVAVVALGRLGDVRERGEETYGRTVVPLNSIGAVRGLLGDIDSQIQRAITDQSGRNRGKYPRIVEDDRQQVDRLMQEYRATITNPAVRERIAGFDRQWPAYQDRFELVLERARVQEPEAAARAYFDGADSLYADLDTALADAGAIHVRQGAETRAAVAADYGAARTMILGLLGVAVLVAAGIALVLARR
jgi:methyl-accepting chemotaxis protein